MSRVLVLMLGMSVAACVASGCKRSETPHPSAQPATTAKPAAPAAATGAEDHAAGEAEDHAHDETPLDTATIGDMSVRLAQGHGKVEAGKEGHLVVKLPYNDHGATIVRAWLGTEDRLSAAVGKGEYAASHDDYDVHAVAPDPLPENVMWWIEIEKPDGTKVVGSARPLIE